MKTRMFLVVWTTVFLFPSLKITAQSAAPSKAIANFNKALLDDIKEDNLHGSISTVVIKRGQLVQATAFGYAAVNSDKMADSSTIYRIGSITKTFTVVVLLQLAEEGKLGLEDAAEKFVPEVKLIKGYSDKTIFTLRQLASHTAGLQREPDMAKASVGPVDQWQKKVLACIPNTSFSSRPGENFLYSNIGFALLGLALERASGKSYIQLVQDRIFTPLHMDDSFFILPEEKRNRLAGGIENSKSGTINTSLPVKEIEGRGYRVPNGGIFSTPLDLAKFAMALIDKSPLLQAASLRQMQHVPPGGKNYGLGLMLDRSGNTDMVGHNGSVPGFTAQFLIDQRTHDAVILMRNYNMGKTNLEEAAGRLLRDL